MNPRPPLFARVLLRITAPARDREFLMQDLGEEFEALLAEGASTKAVRRWYWHQVLGSILPGLTRRWTPRIKRPRSGWFEFLRRDIRWTLRALRKTPSFAAVTVGTLGLGLGAATAMFSVLNGVLLKPLPYEDPDELVSVWHRAPGMNFDVLNQTAATYLTYREENRAFDGIGLWDNNRVAVTGIGEPEQVEVIQVSDETFSVLAARPMLGRLFTQRDDSPEAPVTTILSHGYWQRRFGGDPDVIGRTVTLNGREIEVIGVLNPEFRFLNFEPALFLPFRFDPSTVRGVYGFSYQAVARLKDGVTIEQANADVDRMIPIVFEKFSGGRGVSREEAETMGLGANVRPLKEEVVGNVGNLLWILFGTVGLVLIIACANVANLFLVRAEGRHHEVAVRSALGAGRIQLGLQALTEGVTIALIGGALGVGLAAACLRVVHAVAGERIPRLEEITIDPAVLVFTLAVSLVTGLVFGLYSLRKVGNSDIIASLRESGRGGGQSRSRHRVRRALVVSQLALGLVLLVGAGLMMRSFRALLAVHPGFERPHELLTMRLTIPRAGSEDVAGSARIHEQIRNRVQQVPGVTSVSLSSSVSMDGWDDNNGIYVEEFPLPDDVPPPVHQVKWISAGYFKTMENPVLAGRAITWADIQDRAPVTMVTENFAQKYWGQPASAIGKRIADNWQGPWYEIIGVVGNVHDDGVDRPPTPIVYWPMVRRNRDGSLRTQRSMGYAIRTTRLNDPRFLDEVRQAVWSIDPNLPLASVRTLEEILARSRARTSFLLVMLSISASAAVLLAMVGVYGVISYMVTQRTREIGVRMALGATYGDVNRLVLRQGLALTAVGIGLGLAVASGLTQLMRALLIGVNTVDLPTYTAGAIGLAAIALAASYLPARRAAHVDPVETLRRE